MTLTYGELEEQYVAGGGARALAPLMAGVAESESGGDPSATNPSGATGLWQVLWPLHEGIVPGATSQTALENPQVNAEAAAALTTPDLSAWQTDATWASWNAAGQPSDPSAQTVQSWLAADGLAGSTDAPATSAQLTSAAQGAPVVATGASATDASSLNPNPLDLFGIPQLFTGSAASSVWGDVGPFLVKSTLVVAGLGVMILGVWSLAKGPTEKAVDTAGKAAELGAAL